LYRHFAHDGLIFGFGFVLDFGEESAKRPSRSIGKDFFEEKSL
jgi:hypothetical protein